MPFLDFLRRKSSGKLGSGGGGGGAAMAPVTVTLSYKTLKPWTLEVEEDATVRLVKEFVARQVPDTGADDLKILCVRSWGGGGVGGGGEEWRGRPP